MIFRVSLKRLSFKNARKSSFSDLFIGNGILGKVGYVFGVAQTEQFHRLYNFRMGNSSRSPEDYELVSKFREEEWRHELKEEGLRIWRNRLTNQTAELVRLDGVPSRQDLDVYTTRTMENDLVKVHHLLIDSQSDLCALYNSTQLLIEHIPITLSTLKNFDREEALTIFAAALRGFHLLEIKFGAVVPHEDLIGFNEHGKTKVWLNRDHSLNQADRRFQGEEYHPVSRRVQLLFEMIEQRARYVLLPPVIKEEIYQPISSHLSALKAIEKFAYYQKLNLRKHLQFGHPKNRSVVQPSQRVHTRNRSNFTEAKGEHQICCQKNESSVFSSNGKQNELRRNYSLNNIHNHQTTFFAPPQLVARRSDMQSMVKHSVVSNNSSFFESARPPAVVYYHTVAVPQNVRNAYHRQEVVDACERVYPKANKIEADMQSPQPEKLQAQQQLPPIQAPPTKQPQQLAVRQQKIDEKDEQIQLQQPQQEKEPQQCVILINNKQYSIIDKIGNVISDLPIKHFQSIEEPAEQSSIEPKSPKFAEQPQLKCQLLSFAPSKQNFQVEKASQHQVSYQQELDMVLLEDKIKDAFLKQQEAAKSQQDEQQRRLSIEQKASKLVFTPDFVLNTGSLLNYCTSVQSKLHMATNREHSIIDTKLKQDPPPTPLHQTQEERIQQYIRQKYIQKAEQYVPRQLDKQDIHSKAKRIESEYVTMPPKTSTSKPKLHPNIKYQTSLNSFPVEEDFLDVNFLEKSLDKRYNTEHHHMKAEEKRKEMQDNDALNIAKLEEGLLRFSKSQLSQKNSDVPSKQHIQKRPQHHEQTLEHSTGFDSYYPFKEKKSNEETGYQDPYLHDKSLNRNSGQRRSSKYQEEKAKNNYQHPYHQYEDNVNEYSFEESRKSPKSTSQYIPDNHSRNNYIKQTQYSNEVRGSYDYVNPFTAKQSQPRSSVEQDGRTSNVKAPSTRKISYEQLRQFLWN